VKAIGLVGAHVELRDASTALNLDCTKAIYYTLSDDYGTSRFFIHPEKLLRVLNQVVVFPLAVIVFYVLRTLQED
jgi:hypothetical protein